jgi:hypothetical protein
MGNERRLRGGGKGWRLTGIGVITAKSAKPGPANTVKGNPPIHPKLLLFHPTESHTYSYGSWQVMKGILISIFKAIFFKLSRVFYRPGLGRASFGRQRLSHLRRTSDFRAIALLAMAMLSLLMMAGATGCAAKINPRESLAAQGRAPEGSPKLLAVYQPWFGQKAHIDVGYSCHDPNVLRQQIARAKELNISGFVVNWYGPRKEFEDTAYGLMQQAAAADPSFKVAAQYDEAVDHPGYDTDAVIVDLQYLYDRYIGPEAGPSRSAYLRYNGRPVIFIFPKESNTDWNRIRQVTRSWPDPPLLIYKDMSDKYPDAFDGYYAWVQPGKDGWARDGSNYGEDYLNYFYRNMQEHHPDKIAVGAVWPGFDDSKASWSRNRHIAYRCGKTFEDVLRVFRKYYGSQNAAPYLLVETWNDYEEGTDVERSIGHCGGNSTISSMAAGER